MLFGILKGRSLMLSEVGRALDDVKEDGTPMDLIQTEKRLSRNLLSERFDDEAFEANWWSKVSSHVAKDDGEGVVIAVDYTDAQKPYAQPWRAKGMEFACRCRDGSEGVVGRGFPIAMFTASLPNGQYMPVLAHVFSYDEPSFSKSSEPKVFMECMTRVAPHVGKRAWWAMDRGFENNRYFDHLDRMERRWVTRVKVGDAVSHPQTVFTAGGIQTDVRTLAQARGLGAPFRFTRKVNGRTIRVELERFEVFLSNQKNNPKPVGPARTLLVIRRLRSDGTVTEEPLTVLASEWAGTDAHAIEIYGAFTRRWKVEEMARAEKDSRGWGLRLEDFRSLKLVGIRRLVMLAQAVYLYLVELGLPNATDLAAKLVRTVRRFGDPKDWTYVLFRAVADWLKAMERRQVRAWARGP